MAHSSLINVILLCIVNGVFIFAGTTLNTLVILCLWKSSQLRKKLCYFFILILSCCDLIVVIVSHPLIICLALTWAIEDRRMLERKNIFRWINNFLVGFASITLLTMNIERYLSTAHPLFHRRSVTKRRLVALLALLQVVDFVFTIVQVFLPIHYLFNSRNCNITGLDICHELQNVHDRHGCQTKWKQKKCSEL